MALIHYKETDIRSVRLIADEVEAQLRALVADKCPGPHSPVQHRDRNPPWCHACGRTARGFKIPEEIDEA